jgi:hypothetical protein
LPTPRLLTPSLVIHEQQHVRPERLRQNESFGFPGIETLGDLLRFHQNLACLDPGWTVSDPGGNWRRGSGMLKFGEDCPWNQKVVVQTAQHIRFTDKYEVLRGEVSATTVIGDC